MDEQVLIIGAGIGGLACAVRLALAGCEVTVLDKCDHVGGKARQLAVDGAAIDAGPTVFTLRDVFDDLFQGAGRNLDDYVQVRPVEVIARHAWDERGHLDLFADPARSEDAIGAFAGAAAARGYRSFRTEAARIYRILDQTMLRADKVSWPLPLMRRIGLRRIGDLRAIRPYESLWKAAGEHFADSRLQQLYARYATYCGSSPFQTPATLMLVAEVEAQGVWLIEGGMSALAEALCRLAEELGVTFRLGARVDGIAIAGGKASGVTMTTGERLAADAVVVNADPAALAGGYFGAASAKAAAPMKPQHRSLSAMVWLMHARTQGFALARHNVFFSPDYAREFAEIAGGCAPSDPSVYVCAQDRDAAGGQAPPGRERLQIIVNAPANGDIRSYGPEETAQCTEAMRRSLKRCGLELEAAPPQLVLTPSDFAAFSPSTGGAIYGRASHGWAASFRRQGTTTRIPGLYCAGGSTHPGAGVPMAALSGALAAERILRNRASTRRFHPVATPGGTSTRSATMTAGSAAGVTG